MLYFWCVPKFNSVAVSQLDICSTSLAAGLNKNPQSSAATTNEGVGTKKLRRFFFFFPSLCEDLKQKYLAFWTSQLREIVY